MATKFDKVRLETIEQGSFLAEAEAAFQDVAKKLLAHIEEQTHGSEDLKNKFAAKAGLKLSVGIEYAKGVFHLKTDIDKALPKKPSGLSSAFCNEDPERPDELCLFSQAGGTRDGNPRQMDFLPTEKQ
jgi:hypothetical protein